MPNSESALLRLQFEYPTALRLAGILVLMAVLYFFAYGFFGIGGNDHGVIQALSWRIYNGERMYLDFLHIRPPLSPYLHSLAFWLLPEGSQLLLERLWFYLLMSASVWFSTMSLSLHFDFRKIGIAPEVFGLMAFVLSVHNYPPMPVDTVDSIFFASAGMFALAAGGRMRYHILGLWLLLAAALCRQSFYLMPIVGMVYLLQGQSFKVWSRTIVAGFFPLIVGATLVVLLAPGATQAFFEQTMGNTRLRDLVELGVKPYVKPMMFIFLPMVIIWRINALYLWRNFPAAIYWLIFFFVLGMHVVKGWTKEVYVPPSFGFSQGFFILALAVSIKGFWVQPKGNLLQLSFLLIGWFAGLSWEYASPMLFFAPILFGLVYGLYEELNFRAPQFFYGFVCILLIWVFALLNQYPSDEVYLEDMKYHAGEIYPRLEGIQTGEPMYNRLEEYKELTQQYGERLHVFPEFPQAHLLNNTRNPLPLEAELQIIRWRPAMKQRMEQALQSDVDFILLESGKGVDTTYYGYPWSQHIRTRWHKVEQRDFFTVYQNPASAALLPPKE